MNRRDFLRGVLSLSAVTMLPATALASLPTIWGDGKHDDAPGLNALLAGEPFHVENSSLFARGGLIMGGRFLIGAPLIMGRQGFSMAYCTIEVAPVFPRDGQAVVFKGPVRDVFAGGIRVNDSDGAMDLGDPRYLYRLCGFVERSGHKPNAANTDERLSDRDPEHPERDPSHALLGIQVFLGSLCFVLGCYCLAYADVACKRLKREAFLGYLCGSYALLLGGLIGYVLAPLSFVL